jgi:ribose transport system ATP-binding protein
MTHFTAGTGAAQHPESNAPVLRLNALVKSFGPVRVLDGVSLKVRPGTIHALLGGNGSGKSTTIKVLAGVYAADGGELEVGGVPVDLAGYGPEDAERAGLRFVHQDLGLFDDLSIEENFALASGYPVHAAGGIDWKRLRERVASLIAAYGIAGTPDTPIHRLRPADKTLVAIARALQDEESGRLIVVLDEPTASLGRRESTELLERVQLRAAQGQTFVIVSHRMQEVLAVSDDFTVFRDGKVAAHLIDSSPSEEELIAYMAGSQVRALEPTGSISHARSAPLLAFEGDRSRTADGREPHRAPRRDRGCRRARGLGQVDTALAGIRVLPPGAGADAARRSGLLAENGQAGDEGGNRARPRGPIT